MDGLQGLDVVETTTEILMNGQWVDIDSPQAKAFLKNVDDLASFADGRYADAARKALSTYMSKYSRPKIICRKAGGSL